MNRHKSNLLGILLLIVFIFNSCFKDDLLKEIDALKTQVSSMQKRNDSLNNVLNVRADSLGKALSNAQKRSDSLSNVLRTKSDSLSQALGLTNANLANLSKSVDSIKTQIATISGQLTQLNLQLTSITTQLTQLNQQLGALGGDVSQLAAQYQALSASLQTINNQIAALQAEQLKLLEKLNAILLQLNPPIELTTGLVAYYPFSGNAGDSSGNNLHGVLNGVVLTSDRFGINNKAYLFDGTNEISVPHDNRLNLVANMSISAWFNSYGPPTFRTNHMIVTKRSPSEFNALPYALCINYQFGIPTDYKKPMFASATFFPNYQFLQSSSDVINNSWSHIALTIEGTKLRIFLNGNLVLDTAVNNTMRISNNSPLLIGSGARTDKPSEQFIGKLDDIRIYNRPLSQQEITYLATH